MLNDIVIQRGRYIDGTRPDEAIVNEAFALAHNLTPGDTVTAIINGRRRDLEVVGFGLSPEFIYTIRPGELIPDGHPVRGVLDGTARAGRRLRHGGRLQRRGRCR